MLSSKACLFLKPLFIYFENLFFLFPIVVGCTGFPATSPRYFLQKLGMSPKQVKSSTKQIAEAAESCSRWLWLKRSYIWGPPAGEG